MANKDKIEKLEDLIKDTIEGELVEQKVTSLLPPGENYGSVMYKVDFKVKKDGKEREYHAVAKCTPPNQVTQEIFNTQETFKSEIAWYTTVIPTFKKFAKEQGMEREIDFFQTFYGARISLDPNSDKVDLDGVILTENLKYLGYYNVDRHQGFDAETAINVLKDLACFHAIPLAIRLKDPEELFKKKVNIVCGKFAEPDEKFTGKMDQDLLTVFEHIPEFEPYMDRIRKGVKESKQFGPREIREPWATVIHMDFWCNNIMVTGGTNSKTIILDLQVTGIGSPVCDLIFFLMTSVQLNVIKDKYDEFVKFYYDEFIKNLKALKVDTNNYDFEGFLKEMDIEMKKSEFAHVLAFNQIIQMEKGITTFDSSDASGSYDQMENKTIPINHRQIEKFRWITSEAIKSFFNIDRHVGFDAPTTLSILRDLATFHAVPLALRIKDPELFDKNMKAYCGKYVVEDEQLKELFAKNIILVYEDIPELQLYMDKIRKKIAETNQFAYRKIREPWTTVIHMDFWCNNIMITGGENSKTKILDLQIAMVGSPACDLLFFLLTSVKFDVIKERFDEFVKFYYDEFIKNLTELKVDTSVFDFEGFLKEINIEMSNDEFSHALGFTQMILMDKGVSNFDSSDANFTHDQISDVTVETNHRQIEKFKWITLEAIKRNWL